MSNQQSGYPGPQQPQFGPQYGGYPPPPPPPRSSKAGPIVVAVVGALMLIGAGIFVVSRFTGGSDDAADGTTKPVAPSTKPTLRPASEAPTQQPTTGGSPSAGGSPATQPPAKPTAPSKLPAGCNGCLPGVTVSSLVTAFKSKGYACKLDRRWECNKGTIDVYINPDYSKKKYPEYVDVSGSGSAKVQNCPQCIKAAVASLKQGLPGALAIFVPDASVRQQIITFAMQGAGIPASGPSSTRDAKVGPYRLSTQGYSGATVGKNGNYATFYSTSVSISGVSEY